LTTKLNAKFPVKKKDLDVTLFCHKFLKYSVNENIVKIASTGDKNMEINWRSLKLIIIYETNMYWSVSTFVNDQTFY
jgi:hypothetical protein